MVVGYKPTSEAAANFADNLCRWDRRSAGHYEVWFITLNHRASQRGFWFRYTVEAPLDSAPRAALWAAAFDRARPETNVGLKRECEIDRFAFEGREAFNLRILDGAFSSSRATGRIDQGDRSLAWDLRFAPNEKTFHHVKPALTRLVRPSSFVCSPNLDTRFSGVISVDGREHFIEDEPGCQSHLWGRKRVDEWVWVHSNAFDKHPDTVFEGLAARPRRAGRMLPPIQTLYLSHRGEKYRFTRLRLAEQWKRSLGIGYWSFSATSARLHIEGVAQCRLRDMMQVEYCDPDGERLYCLNSEVANMKIRLFRRARGVHWRHVETINARSTTHLEHACRTADPNVKMAFE
ncbi:MAG TPA: tocopherol cyclase family protein [Blastocatellia bacterium]|nr:tocopherol cyclase family protein [Blastocatellia bacterium]